MMNEQRKTTRLPKDATAKSPDQKFWMDCKKDKIGNFERGCLQSNHRKVTDFGLLQDFKRMIMTFGRRVSYDTFSCLGEKDSMEPFFVKFSDFYGMSVKKTVKNA